MFLFFSAISASKCSYFVLKILCSLMAPNVVIHTLYTLICACTIHCTGITFHKHHIVTDKEPVLISICILFFFLFVSFLFFFVILFTGRPLTLLTIQITIPTFKLILQLLVILLILTKSIYTCTTYNTYITLLFLQYTMMLKTNYIAE